MPPAVPPVSTELVDVDPCAVPCVGVGVPAGRQSQIGLPVVGATAKLVVVQRVEPPKILGPLAWGTTDGRAILFRVHETTGRELQAALDAGEEPTAIVAPEQVVALDIVVLR